MSVNDGHDYDYEAELEAAIRRVRDLHTMVIETLHNGTQIELCGHCADTGDPFHVPDGADKWPCRTVAALMDVEV